MEAATAGKCPAFETPTSLPELSALTGGHTASGGYHSAHFGEKEEEEFGEEEGEEGEGEEKEEGAEETEEAPAEEAPEEEVTHAPAGGGVSPG